MVWIGPREMGWICLVEKGLDWSSGKWFGFVLWKMVWIGLSEIVWICLVESGLDLSRGKWF